MCLTFWGGEAVQCKVSCTLTLGSYFRVEKGARCSFSRFLSVRYCAGRSLSFTNKLTLAGLIVTPLNLENSRNTHLLLWNQFVDCVSSQLKLEDQIHQLLHGLPSREPKEYGAKNLLRRPSRQSKTSGRYWSQQIKNLLVESSKNITSRVSKSGRATQNESPRVKRQGGEINFRLESLLKRNEIINYQKSLSRL